MSQWPHTLEQIVANIRPAQRDAFKLSTALRGLILGDVRWCSPTDNAYDSLRAKFPGSNAMGVPKRMRAANIADTEAFSILLSAVKRATAEEPPVGPPIIPEKSSILDWAVHLRKRAPMLLGDWSAQTLRVFLFGFWMGLEQAGVDTEPDRRLLAALQARVCGEKGLDESSWDIILDAQDDRGAARFGELIEMIQAEGRGTGDL